MLWLQYGGVIAGEDVAWGMGSMSVMLASTSYLLGDVNGGWSFCCAGGCNAFTVEVEAPDGWLAKASARACCALALADAAMSSSVDLHWG
jgi:hypothetical protein